MLKAAHEILAGLNGPQLALLGALAAGIFGAGLGLGRHLWRPRPDFRRYELPPEHRIH